MLAVILYTAIAVSRVLAQTNFTSGSETGAYDNDVLMCDTTFARANGTGIYSFDPQEPQGTTVGSYDPNAPAITWVSPAGSHLNLADTSGSDRELSIEQNFAAVRYIYRSAFQHWWRKLH